MTPPPAGLANAAGSQRLQMAAASSICQISPTRCQARTRLYRDGRLELEGRLFRDERALPRVWRKAGFAASVVTIVLTGLVLYLIFKRKEWL